MLFIKIDFLNFLILSLVYFLLLLNNVSTITRCYYVDLVNNVTDGGSDYVFPTNANIYLPKNDNIIDFGTFDFIIVGSGSGGSVVAHRLSSVSKWTVLLLEAGTFGDNITDIPGLYHTVEFTPYNWAFFSTPQNASCLGMVNNQCPLPRGRGVGGTTLINGLVYSRGSSLDFDRWAAIGNPGWSYKEVLPLFKRSENFHHRDRDAPVIRSIHGTCGPLNVEYHLPGSPQLDVFLDAIKEIGVPVRDYNSGTGLGASPAQINTKNGRRFDDGKAFVRPILNRRNLNVSTNSYVTKILINNDNEATGVLFSKSNQMYRARARREVIISAGTYQTPQLLMLSGIGPQSHLESLNIPIKSNLPGVGKFLDHPTFFGLSFKTNYSTPNETMEDYMCEFLNGRGLYTAPGNNQGVSFFESSFTQGTGLPDIEIMMIPANATTDLSQRAYNLRDETYDVIWRDVDPRNSFILYIACLHAFSEGEIRLNSSNPFEYPLIDPRFLSDPQNKDIDTLYEGLQIAFKLVETEAFKRINTTLQGRSYKACEQYEFLSKDYWYCAIRQMSFDLYHPIGSARMGPNPNNGSVVNHQNKVYGIKRLRVADASVIPFTLAGHPNAPTVMIGEKVSDMIKAEHL